MPITKIIGDNPKNGHQIKMHIDELGTIAFICTAPISGFPICHECAELTIIKLTEILKI